MYNCADEMIMKFSPGVITVSLAYSMGNSSIHTAMNTRVA